MMGQPLRQTHLIVPTESVLRVLGEFHIIRRVSINQVSRIQCEAPEILRGELPAFENPPVLGELSPVVNSGVAAKGYIEEALLIEPAQTVIAGAVEVVEEAGRFRTPGSAAFNHCIEAVAVSVVNALFIFQREIDGKTTVDPTVEIDEMRVYIVE